MKLKIRSKFVVMGTALCIMLFGASYMANAHYSGKYYHDRSNDGYRNGGFFGMFGSDCGNNCYTYNDHYGSSHKYYRYGHDQRSYNGCNKCKMHCGCHKCKVKCCVKCDYGCKKPVVKKCDYGCKKPVKRCGSCY